MSVPKKATVSGAVDIGPIQPTAAPFPSTQCVASLASEMTTQADYTQARSITSPSSFVDLLASTGITNVRLLVLRARAGTFQVRVTSDNSGVPLVDQIFTLSDLLVITNPSSGSQFTAVAVQGVGDLEITIAGD